MLSRFISLPVPSRLILLEAACWLAAARLALLLFPFRLIAWAWLGTAAAPAPIAESGVKDAEAGRIVEAVCWAIRSAVRHLPFEAVCLPQAMAAKWMLRRRGIPARLHLVVRRGEAGEIEGHACLDAAGKKVTGFPMAAEFVELAVYN